MCLKIFKVFRLMSWKINIKNVFVSSPWVEAVWSNLGFLFSTVQAAAEHRWLC